jgi:hypothetical protein
MKNTHSPLSTYSYISAFLVGAILFWSFGKSWLDLKSAPLFLAGLTGVALAVLVFAACKVLRSSQHRGK